ncbi:MAG TPA: undecaprenyldiphospho-muramoylpentapeptide beta-N-acetylglucosaminyltransferase [Candidatus Acidoferrum sp.]|nr:undecaprenyldiphospho-muramoylpentapeptide beta-N-acetylglucosaminyltransferase [Candidatus Acidoferrum sp.]
MNAALHPTILIMAGGTGGHVFPALTIAQELRAQGSRVEWLGTRAGIEARVLANTGIPLHFISVAGLRGKSLVRKLLAPFTLLYAVVQALLLIRRVNPDCVLGMGGYVTGPGGVAARLLGKTLLIHEQNAVAGLANAMLFPLAQKALEGFSGAFVRKLDGSMLMRDRVAAEQKITWVGNPVRAEILAIATPEQRLSGRHGPVRLLVVGGSLGAAVFNELVPAALAGLNEAERPQVRHQCGRSKLDATLQAYRNAGLATTDALQVSEFIDDMAAAYSWADVVLCRAGASTLAEIAAIGLPAILVPYPFAADDHQRANAEQLANTGAANVLPQAGLTAAVLRDVLRRSVADRQRLLQQAAAALRAGKRDAGAAVARLCLEACHG